MPRRSQSKPVKINRHRVFKWWSWLELAFTVETKCMQRKHSYHREFQVTVPVPRLQNFTGQTFWQITFNPQKLYHSKISCCTVLWNPQLMLKCMHTILTQHMLFVSISICKQKTTRCQADPSNNDSGHHFCCLFMRTIPSTSDVHTAFLHPLSELFHQLHQRWPWQVVHLRDNAKEWLIASQPQVTCK